MILTTTEYIKIADIQKVGFPTDNGFGYTLIWYGETPETKEILVINTMKEIGNRIITALKRGDKEISVDRIVRELDPISNIEDVKKVQAADL